MADGEVLSGMGGVGKTQLAAARARTAWQAGELDLLVWVTASARTAIVDAYAQAAVRLLGADPADPDTAAARLLAWLEPAPGERPHRWMIVLDDLADPADLRGLWPPRSPCGRTLITTRRRDAALTGPGRRAVEVEVFSAAEAVAYLSHGRTDPPGEIAALAGDLGYLPLALSQAAAYLHDAGLDCAAYRRLLADRARSLADLLPEPGTLPDDQSVTVAAAWSLSIDRADALRPVGWARPVLQFLSMLDPNGIPAVLLPLDNTSGALRALHRLSLVHHADGQVRVHQLIQRAVRETLTAEEYGVLARGVAARLLAAWPDVEREADTQLVQSLRANTAALAAHAEEHLHRPDMHQVLFRAGSSLGESGRISDAVEYYRQLAPTTRRHLGVDHPSTLLVRGHLARWQGLLGDVAGATLACVELQDDLARVLGADHPETLTIRANLTYWQASAGDLSGAIASLTRLRDDFERVLGPDHPTAIGARANLATLQGQAGDPAGAAASLEQVLAARTRVLGVDHPHTLSTRTNLATAWAEAGDLPRATLAYEQLLADSLRWLGPDHPRTLSSRGNLAMARGAGGDAAGAATALEELLADRIRVLGPDHPDVLKNRGNAAFWRRLAGPPAR
ncbi:tetratricopeptide repeat protein [Streptomyces sp. NPDC059443]|uniref:tetratricopeptide repeat protein n=1 Tax=unclassified Streptomyces TaxID=2593676 RepID=UPI0036B1F7E9